ncbi:MAG: CsgG/HfaB family protein [Candidatus Hydrogenedentes bacterium]|nr:CsgG/HfaB family protein [Candidatus Hydrogenedentota bacterium]
MKKVVGFLIMFLGYSLCVTGEEIYKLAVLDILIPYNVVNLKQGFEHINWGVEKERHFNTIFITVLSNSKKFSVVEREVLSDINKERFFSELSRGEKITDPGFGSADYCIVGEITKLVAEEVVTQIPYSNFVKEEFRGEVEFLVRMVSVRTGEIVVARSVSVNKLVPKTSSPEGFLDDLMKETAENAVALIIEGAYPSKIAHIDANFVYINRGRDSGYKVGTLLGIYALGKEIVDPDTKRKLGYEESFVGKVEIVEIMSKMSKAKVVEGSIENMKVGMVCKVEEAKPYVPPKPLTPGSSPNPVKWE